MLYSQHHIIQKNVIQNKVIDYDNHSLMNIILNGTKFLLQY